MESVFSRKEKCCGCGLCAQTCPHGAITMKEDEEDFRYPCIDSMLCTDCGACQKACAFTASPSLKPLAYYAARHTDANQLFRSSSGGVFAALAEYVIGQGGVVFGAVFNDEWHVLHTAAQDMQGILPMHGSKYIPSDIQSVYETIARLLREGKMVLFTGVPCQVAAVRKWLSMKKIPDERFYALDIVCHGTPSPRIWDAYLEAFRAQYGTFPQSLSFRSKDLGWSARRVKATLPNGRDVTEEWACQIDFFNLWNSQCMNRLSCHVCPYADEKRTGDFTAGDFIGIEKLSYAYPAEEGVSVLTVNTRKAESILKQLSLDLMAVTQKQCAQQALEYAAAAPKERAVFWDTYHRSGYEGLVKKYGRMTLEKRIIYGCIVPLCKKLGIYHFAAKLYLKGGRNEKEKHANGGV